MKIRNPKYPFKQCGPWENCPICFEDFSLTPCTNCGNGFEDEYIEVPSKIEQLTARIAELEEENARLVKLDAKRKKQLSDFDDVIDDLNVVVSCINPVEDLKRAIAALKEQLAASQLHAEQLREAIDRVRSGAAALGLDRIFDIATEALALPRDTSALDAYIAEKVKEATK